jgi:hypothetical protein
VARRECRTGRTNESVHVRKGVRTMGNCCGCGPKKKDTKKQDKPKEKKSGCKK